MRLLCKAQELGYDDIAKAITYLNDEYSQKFADEAKSLKNWRSQVWVYCYQKLDDYNNGIISEIPSAEELIAELPELVITYTENVETEQTLESIIASKIKQSNEYADSDEMNSYVAMGVTIRLPLELRLRLRNVINAKINLGETEMTEYYEDHSYTYPLTAWDKQLTQYENYLYEVSCVAEQHKLNIQNLTTIEDVEAYDYTTGYPEQLNFDTINSSSTDDE